jgi:hypothetical protein
MGGATKNQGGKPLRTVTGSENKTRCKSHGTSRALEHCNMKEEEHERPAGTLRETEAAAAGTFTAANTGRTLTYSVQG